MTRTIYFNRNVLAQKDNGSFKTAKKIRNELVINRNWGDKKEETLCEKYRRRD